MNKRVNGKIEIRKKFKTSLPSIHVHKIVFLKYAKIQDINSEIAFYQCRHNHYVVKLLDYAFRQTFRKQGDAKETLRARAQEHIKYTGEPRMSSMNLERWHTVGLDPRQNTKLTGDFPWNWWPVVVGATNPRLATGVYGLWMDHRFLDCFGQVHEKRSVETERIGEFAPCIV